MVVEGAKQMVMMKRLSTQTFTRLIRSVPIVRKMRAAGEHALFQIGGSSRRLSFMAQRSTDLGDNPMFFLTRALL